jgi:hypothetical protein
MGRIPRFDDLGYLLGEAVRRRHARKFHRSAPRWQHVAVSDSVQPHASQPIPAVRSLTTPRAAAVAGVVFAVLFATVVILVRAKMPESPDGSVEWLRSRGGGIAIAAVLMPFAGIAFLWFLAVIRDGFGAFEDRFFATSWVAGCCFWR